MLLSLQFFLLSNDDGHGYEHIGSEHIGQVWKAAEDLFDCPLEAKLAVSVASSTNNRGYFSSLDHTEFNKDPAGMRIRDNKEVRGVPRGTRWPSLRTPPLPLTYSDLQLPTRLLPAGQLPQPVSPAPLSPPSHRALTTLLQLNTPPTPSQPSRSPPHCPSRASSWAVTRSSAPATACPPARSTAGLCWSPTWPPAGPPASPS